MQQGETMKEILPVPTWIQSDFDESHSVTDLTHFGVSVLNSPNISETELGLFNFQMMKRFGKFKLQTFISYIPCIYVCVYVISIAN